MLKKISIILLILFGAFIVNSQAQVLPPSETRMMPPVVRLMGIGCEGHGMACVRIG